jgi:CRP/FNR family cyclic AMP-dependent transcriptional regulator
MIFESFENPYPKFEYEHEMIDLIHELGVKESFPPATTFHAPYMDTNRFYFIHKGRCRVYITSEDGREKIMAILDENAFFGSTQLITRRNEDLFIVSDSPVVLYSIDAKSFWNLMSTNLKFRDMILNQLSNLFSATTKQLGAVTFRTCKERLYAILLKNIDEDSSKDGSWYQLRRKVTQNDLSKLIGASRFTVTKLIAELSEDGLVRTINNKMEIKNK